MSLVPVRDETVTPTRQLVLPGAEPRGALIVDLALPIGPLRIIAAHLGLLRRSRAHQVKALVSAAETKDGRPTLLMGDLNEWRVGQRSSLRQLEPALALLTQQSRASRRAFRSGALIESGQIRIVRSHASRS